MRAEENELKATKEQRQKTLQKLHLEFELESMAMIAELKHPYKAAHERRTAHLAGAIADEMGLSKERIRGLKVATLLRDIGEIQIPAGILSKTAELGAHEYEIIRAHPKVGYDILMEIEFPWPVARIVLQHHERMDGSGYPEGLANGEIMLEARILGVADVVEAMVSPRPYRPAFGIDKALEEISKNKGILYDPEVVDACLRLFTEKGFEFPS
ncbi:HD-GYP domain-containing protein [Acidobacteria bacterium AH-259-L09]|nr:HD-GYP domain-containing protein [Acidobacteria bacterium AH-259-L09]